MTFPERFKELRKRGNLTQAQAAAALGVVESTVRNWERDANAPEVSTLILVSLKTGASVDYLLGLPGATFEGEPKWAIEPRASGARRRARPPTPRETEALREAEELADQDDPPQSQTGDEQAS